MAASESRKSSFQGSLWVQGVYALLMGLMLLAAPGWLGSLLRLPTDHLWVRVVGLLAVALAVYYFAAARAGESGRWFARASLYGRAVAVFGLIALALVFGYPWLVLVALCEAALTLWTWRTLT